MIPFIETQRIYLYIYDWINRNINEDRDGEGYADEVKCCHTTVFLKI